VISLKLKKKAINSILNKGYFVFKSAIKESYIDNLNNKLTKLKSLKQSSFYQTKKTTSKIIINLQSKDKKFLNLIDNRDMNKINSLLLNDNNYKNLKKILPNYIISQFVARSSGNTKCEVHMDDKVPSTSKNVNYLQWAIPLVSLNKKNGCTQILEKSHKKGLDKPSQSTKRFKDLNLNKGDIAVWDGRIWHSARPNKSNKDRWVIILTFARWFFKPHYDIPRSFPKKFYKYLNNNKKIILGFASIPKSSEKISTYQRGDLNSAEKFIKKRIF
jgi:ectoine hydroxylase-related dioxygenase (phytanoyl-CoA dioxygenase family)